MWHGGMSTGPRTTAGMKRSLANLTWGHPAPTIDAVKKPLAEAKTSAKDGDRLTRSQESS